MACYQRHCWIRCTTASVNSRFLSVTVACCLEQSFRMRSSLCLSASSSRLNSSSIACAAMDCAKTPAAAATADFCCTSCCCMALAVSGSLTAERFSSQSHASLRTDFASPPELPSDSAQEPVATSSRTISRASHVRDGMASYESLRGTEDAQMWPRRTPWGCSGAAGRLCSGAGCAPGC